jgi:hypothetical protein
MSDDVEELNHREESLRELARNLNLDPRELLGFIGGPWDMAVDPSTFGSASNLPGFVFVGRAGPSVLIHTHDGQVCIGQAQGEWHDPGSLIWGVADPIVTIPLAELDGRMTEFGGAVEAAYEAKRHLMNICRYCGQLYASEYMFDADTCSGCAGQIMGVMF